MDPTHVFKILIRFRGVYIEVYNIRFANPRLAVRPFTPKYKIPNPLVPAAVAKSIACNGLKRKESENSLELIFSLTYVNLPQTNTLCLVLDI